MYDYRMLKKAKEEADKSNRDKCKTGCVVGVKGKEISRGRNWKEKTHPVQKEENRERFQEDSKTHSMHAEIHALTSIKGKGVRWKDVTVYIARRKGVEVEGIVKWGWGVNRKLSNNITI